MELDILFLRVLLVTKVFDDGYIFASLVVESLFANVPLHWTISIILDHVYNHKLKATQLKKQALKKVNKRHLQ